MPWSFNNTEALFLQIAKQLRFEILSGKYLPNEQFPSVRQLAYEASVNPNTMQKALTCLENEGLLISRTTVGRFVTGDTDVIKRASDQMKKEAVLRLVAEAKTLGITPEEFTKHLKEGGESE